jgi:hypothetical protein
MTTPHDFRLVNPYLDFTLILPWYPAELYRPKPDKGTPIFLANCKVVLSPGEYTEQSIGAVSWASLYAADALLAIEDTNNGIVPLQNDILNIEVDGVNNRWVQFVITVGASNVKHNIYSIRVESLKRPIEIRVR